MGYLVSLEVLPFASLELASLELVGLEMMSLEMSGLGMMNLFLYLHVLRRRYNCRLAVRVWFFL